MAKKSKKKVVSEPIVTLIEKRLSEGYNRYKNELPLDDGRDWQQEALEEILDGMIYVANDIILYKQNLDEPKMDMPGFEGTWNELRKIRAMGGDAVGMLKSAVKESALSEMKKNENYCIECASILGLDCGHAEQDYNEDFCSQGCYNVFILRHNK